MPTLGNPKLTIRMPPEHRGAFITAAYNNGTTASELVTQFIAWWMNTPGAELPQRPETP